MKEHTYYIKGMHCASCEILIEKRLLEFSGVKSVSASTSNGQATIEYEGQLPDINGLNNIFKKDNYKFFNHPYSQKTGTRSNHTLTAFGIALGIVIVFFLLDKIGISKIVSINSASSVFAFFAFGLLAGASSCAALAGGIVLSMSRQWQGQKLQPHFLFNIGRVLSYAVWGGVLGLIGGRLQLSFHFTSFLITAVSFLMIGLGLQMLGARGFRKFQFALPKSITRYIANENNFEGRYMPFALGFATFFLPCGFTVTAQGLALLSESAMQGALIMGAFALGTVPMLLLVGFSSAKFLDKPKIAMTFSKTAGFLVIFFALFNISNQINTLDFSGIRNAVIANQNNLAPIINGKQLIKMTVYGVNYDPNYFKIKAGVPVRWEITSSGQPSCASGAIVSKILPNGYKYLNPNQGQVSAIEFTPQTPGKYQFSCTMGMIRGIVEVVN